MGSPEHKPRKLSQSITQDDTPLTVADIERLLEQNDVNENTIERTEKREVLLYLLDQIQSDD